MTAFYTEFIGLEKAGHSPELSINPAASTGAFERCLAVTEGYPLPKTQASLTPVTLEKGVKIACELLENTSNLRNKKELATLLVMKAIRPKKDLYSLNKVPEQGACGIVVASCISNNMVTRYIGGLLDASRMPVFGSLVVDPSGYVAGGTSAAEMLTSNKPGDQISMMTLWPESILIFGSPLSPFHNLCKIIE